MIKNKQITIKVFDEDILKPGVKIHCKNRDCIEQDESLQKWIDEFDAEIFQVSDDIICVKTLEEAYLGSRWLHYDTCSICIDDVIAGWWVIEII